jgi:NRAMP (natural resistance-associated macrophage protein)-like metal ion transporter
MKRLFGRFNRPHLLFILAILGPGLIAGFVDNDAPGIATYSLAGARFGYSLLWILLITIFELALLQELGARMGIVTGKGLASLIRENFGLRWAALAMAVLFIANIGTVAGELAGLSAALHIFHIPVLITTTVAAIVIILVLTRFNFRKAEILFLIVSFIYFVYLISGIKAHPDWSLAVKDTFIPSFQMSKYFIFTTIAVVGTTITPWGQFLIQSFVVDKKLGLEHLNYERLDVFLGSFFTNFIAFFIVIATAATIWAHGLHVNNVADAAIALRPFAGNAASILFSIGLLNAALFGLAIIPLSTAYVITEGFGWESGINKSFREAKEFYFLIAISIVVGAAIVAFPHFNLLSILFISQALNGLLLPVILVFVLILAANKEVMGEYRNKGWVNAIAVLTVVSLSVLSVVTAFSFLPIFK